MKTKRILAWLAVLLVAAVPAARGAGFLIYEHGAAAMAMGGAFTAVANNPTAIWHNPAGLAWLDGTQLMLGATFIIPTGSVTMPYLGPLTVKQVNQVFTPPNFYFTHKFSDRITAGIGFMAPFGLGTKWQKVNNSPPDFPLAYLGYYNDMQTFFVNPAIAIKLLDNLSLGLGCSYIFSTLKLDLYQRLGPFIEGGDSYDAPTAMKATGNSFNFNAGLLYKGKGFSLGASYRSHFNIKYSGTVAIDNEFIPAPFQPYIPTSGDVKTTFKFPDILTLGVAINVTPKLVWSFDVHTYFWKRFDSYTADITFPSPFPAQSLTAPQLWKNSQCYRMGFAYQATDKLSLRLGTFFDETPQPTATMDPNLPDSDRWAVQGGLGYVIGKFTVDIGAHFEHFLARTSENGYIFGLVDSINPAQGTYKMQALLLGINFGYKF